LGSQAFAGRRRLTAGQRPLKRWPPRNRQGPAKPLDAGMNDVAEPSGFRKVTDVGGIWN
jgi:hypothetical protein